MLKAWANDLIVAFIIEYCVFYNNLFEINFTFHLKDSVSKVVIAISVIMIFTQVLGILFVLLNKLWTNAVIMILSFIYNCIIYWLIYNYLLWFYACLDFVIAIISYYNASTLTKNVWLGFERHSIYLTFENVKFANLSLLCIISWLQCKSNWIQNLFISYYFVEIEYIYWLII